LLLALSLLVITPLAKADTLSVVTPPVISLTKSGAFVTLKHAAWSSTSTAVVSWLVNGKETRVKNSDSLPSPSKKGTTIRVRESSQGVVAYSNILTIGNVAVNGVPSIAFIDNSQSELVLTLPPTTPLKPSAKIQWFSGPFEVKGAHSLTYHLSTGDQGADISVKVVYSAPKLGQSSAISNSITIPVISRTYSLLWSDEFNPGKGLDSKVWSPENGDGTSFNNRGWGNQERQWYLDSQAKIDQSGALSITATRDNAAAQNCYYGKPCEWTSSKLVTKGKVGFKYGRIEARIKGPVGSGTWGAFWMLGANIDDRPWPGCGEIDVTELLGRDPLTNYGTPHGPASGTSYTTTMDKGFADDYHTYAVDWLPDQITWYVDGKAFGSLNKSSLDDPSHTWVFDHEYYLIVNLAMGGTFGGPIDDSLKNANLSVDYVRAYSINGVGEVIQH